MRIPLLVSIALCIAPIAAAQSIGAPAAVSVRTTPAGTDDYRFEPLLPLPDAIGLHSATLLTSGEVVIAGGYGDSGPTANAVLFDPAERAWRPTGALNETRFGHAAIRLASGQVLAFGGDGDDGSLASAERYDPASRQWQATGSMATSRDRFGAALLADGRVLVAGGDHFAGGSGSVLDSAELYDPASGQWSAAAPLAEARMSHTVTALASGKVLAVGGYSAVQNAAIASAELYDPATGTWSAAAPMPGPRIGHTATRLASGQVLVVGGAAQPFGTSLDDALLYDPATNAWSTTLPLSFGRNGHSASLLPSGKVLVAGGGNAFDIGPTDSAELYDPATNAWTPAAPLSTRRLAHEATTLASGEVLISGGQIPVAKVVYTAAAELFTNLGSASAAVSSALLTFTAPAGATASAVLALSNTGPANTTLHYVVGTSPDACPASGDVAWLRADPNAGAVNGGTSAAVTITVDATRLPRGAYSASLCVTSSDATQPLISVPVEVVVAPREDAIFEDGFEAVQPVQDPGFETTNVAPGFWTATDSYADDVSPFRPGHQAAHTGNASLWLGGWFAGDLTQTAAQSVVIPAGSPRYLNYWRKVEFAPEGTQAMLTISLDGHAVETTDLMAVPAAYEYVARSVDIGAYADGAAHRLEIRYDYVADPEGFAFDGITMIDDVTIDTVPQH